MFKYKSLITSSVFILLVGLALLPATAHAQTAQASSVVEEAVVNISGEVINADDQSPVAGLTVAIAGEDKTADTNDQGKFSFKNLSPGTYTLEVNDSRFESLSKEVEITNQETEKKITLKVKPKY